MQHDAQFSQSIRANFSDGVARAIEMSSPDTGFALAAQELAECEGVCYQEASARVRRRYPTLHFAYLEMMQEHIGALTATEAQARRGEVHMQAALAQERIAQYSR